jgi:hypothetical protein
VREIGKAIGVANNRHKTQNTATPHRSSLSTGREMQANRQAETPTRGDVGKVLAGEGLQALVAVYDVDNIALGLREVPEREIHRRMRRRALVHSHDEVAGHF